MPTIDWADFEGFFIQHTQGMEAVVDLPQVGVELCQGNRFLSQDFGQVNEFASPFDFFFVSRLAVLRACDRRSIIETRSSLLVTT